MNLHQNLLLRRLVLPLLKIFNRDIFISHPWTNDRVRLSLFEHKGYWFHGKNRENDEMLAFGRLIQPGACVIEVGGHIGFISLFYSKLVTPPPATAGGQVIVFEPGINNLQYLKTNVAKHSNVNLVVAACSDSDGESIFYIDNLTGQNNSLVASFDGLKVNSSNAPGISVGIESVTVATVKLDSYCAEFAIKPDFIKIDVEGHEFAVLTGADRTLSDQFPPILMVEIQSDHEQISNLLHLKGYDLYGSNGQLIDNVDIATSGNFFALHQVAHQEAKSRWLIST